MGCGVGGVGGVGRVGGGRVWRLRWWGGRNDHAFCSFANVTERKEGRHVTLEKQCRASKQRRMLEGKYRCDIIAFARVRTPILYR